MPWHIKGLSLLEITFTLLIIAILASIAIPSYHQYVIETRRADGKLALADLASRLERYYALNQTYQGATWHKIDANPISSQGYYTLKFAHLGTTSFVIEAIPEGSQKNDRECAKFIYNELGEKAISGSGTIEQCWLT